MSNKPLKPAGFPNKNPRINGFTLLESLAALMCASLVISLCAGAMQINIQMIRSMSHQGREMGILQLREYAAGYDTLSVQDGILEMENSAKSCTLEFHKGRIVRRPGYEIFLEDLEDGSFYEENGIWLEITYNGNTQSWQIAE